MAVAQGIKKQTVIAKQSGLGTPATTGGQILRRTNSVFQAPADTFTNPEIVSHQQSTGANYGVNRANGKSDHLLSPSTLKLPLQSLMRKDFVAGVAASGASVTIAGAGPTYTVTRAAGSYLSDGFKVGDVIRLTVGTLNAANISKNLLITAVGSATVITVLPVNGVAMVAEGPITGTTITVVGKKTMAPLTGHTTDYYTVEEWYPDLTKSETFNDMMVAMAQVKCPPTGNATVSFDWVGRSRVLNNSQQIAAPAVETTSNVLTAVNGVVLIGGAQFVTVTGLDLSISGNTANLDPVVGSNTVPDNQRGRIEVSGSFSAFFDSTTIQTIFQNRTTTSLVMVITDSSLAAADFVTLSMSMIKITSDPPDDGEKAIVRSYNFTAQINGSGGGALANDQTILSIQDSLA